MARIFHHNFFAGINHENRYRDRNSFYVQAEARRELFWRIGGVLFAGCGNVYSNLSAFQLKAMKYVVGLGGRFRPFKNEKLNLRLDNCHDIIWLAGYLKRNVIYRIN